MKKPMPTRKSIERFYFETPLPCRPIRVRREAQHVSLDRTPFRQVSLPEGAWIPACKTGGCKPLPRRCARRRSIASGSESGGSSRRGPRAPLFSDTLRGHCRDGFPDAAQRKGTSNSAEDHLGFREAAAVPPRPSSHPTI